MRWNRLAWILAVAVAVAAAVFSTAGSALAQDGEPLPPEQIAAQELFKEGNALEEESKFDEAVAKYEEAFEVFPDAGLWARIGQAYQKKGNAKRDFEAYKKAIAAYKKYLELDPNPAEATVTELNSRVEKLEKAIADEEARIAREAEEAKKEKIEEERLVREEAERVRKEKEAKEGMRPAFNAMVVSGVDQDISAIARLIAGGFLNWGRFAVEGHVAFDGFLRVDDTKGLAGYSISLDLGTRFAFSGENFRGPFIALGGSFGLLRGRPRDRKLTGDMETCAGFDDLSPGNCAFDIDKNIAGRAGFGYGFAASKKTTVAVRLDFTYWLLSVDAEQSALSVPAARVDKPQASYSVLIGLEFMRWFR